MAMRVTFDTNAFDKVVRPNVYAKDPLHSEYAAIHDALKRGDVHGSISETVVVEQPARKPIQRGGQIFAKRILAALVFGALVFPASAQDAKVSVNMIGIGSMSCAHWRSTKEQLAEGTVWIYGFWTGLNYVAAASKQAQAKIDVATIVADVEETCDQQMSQTLASAVWTTYIGAKR